MAAIVYSRAVGDGWDVMISTSGRTQVLHFHQQYDGNGNPIPPEPSPERLAETIRAYEDAILDNLIDLETDIHSEDTF